jgi:ankyrin repeat protein
MWQRVEALILKGADIKAKDKNGVNVLGIAVGWGRVEVVQLLLAERADVNARVQVESHNGKFEAPLLSFAVRSGNIAIVKLLLNAGVDVDANDGSTASSTADTSKNLDAAKLLLKSRIAADLGTPPLYLALQAGNLEMAELLLAHGARIEAKHATLGLNALDFVLAYSPNYEVLQWLLERGAKPRKVEEDDFAIDSLDRAHKTGNPRIINLITRNLFQD